jgi:hypothetical protein
LILYLQVQQTYLRQVRDIMATLAQRQRAALLAPQPAPVADMGAVSRACAAAMGIIQTVSAAAAPPPPVLGGLAPLPSSMLQAMLAAAPVTHAPAQRGPCAQALA